MPSSHFYGQCSLEILKSGLAMPSLHAKYLHHGPMLPQLLAPKKHKQHAATMTNECFILFQSVAQPRHTKHTLCCTVAVILDTSIALRIRQTTLDPINPLVRGISLSHVGLCLLTSDMSLYMLSETFGHFCCAAPEVFCAARAPLNPESLRSLSMIAVSASISKLLHAWLTALRLTSLTQLTYIYIYQFVYLIILYYLNINIIKQLDALHCFAKALEVALTPRPLTPLSCEDRRRCILGAKAPERNILHNL